MQRKSKVNRDEIKMLLNLGVPKTKIAEKCGCSVRTVYTISKEPSTQGV